MDAGGVDQGHVGVAVGEQQALLGAGEDDRFGAVGDQFLDDREVVRARFVGHPAAGQLVVDHFVYADLAGVVRDDDVDPGRTQPVGEQPALHREPRSEQAHSRVPANRAGDEVDQVDEGHTTYHRADVVGNEVGRVGGERYPVAARVHE